jgi:hypothetical protein
MERYRRDSKFAQKREKIPNARNERILGTDGIVKNPLMRLKSFFQVR